MRRFVVAFAVGLIAGCAAFAQPVSLGGLGPDAFPVQLSVASLAAITPDGTQGVRLVIDDDDCVVGGAAGVVLCIDTGAAWEPVGAGAGTDDQTAAEVPYAPTTPGDWTDPDPTEVLAGLDDLASRLTAKEAETLAGDVTGPPSATVVGDNTHNHDTTTVSGLDAGDVTTGTFADALVSDALTVAGGAISTSTIVLDTGADPTTDGQIRWDTTTERVEIGDDGVATLELFPGPHVVDTGPSPDCSGDLTYQDGEGGCDPYTLHGSTADLATVSGVTPSGNLATWDASGNLIDGGAAGGGDAVTVNTAPVDTTADLTDSASLDWTLTDGGAGGPDTVTGSVVGIDGDGDGTLSATDDGSTLSITLPTTIDGGGTGGLDITNVSVGFNSYAVRVPNNAWYSSKNAAGATIRLFSLADTNDVFFGAVDNAGGKVLIREDGINTISISGGLTETLRSDAGGFGLAVRNARFLADGGATLRGTTVIQPQSLTCTDSGDANPGSLTLIPTTSNVELTVSDPDGCGVTISETGATPGQTLEVTVVSIAGGTANFADASGIQEMGTGCNLPLYGTLGAKYIEAGANDRWVKRFCETDV